MKIIKPEGTIPGIEDGLITYAGSFMGTAHIYKIQTKCKTLLWTRITAYPTTAPRPASVIEVPYIISVNTNLYKYVQFTAKAGYTFYYEVAGTEKSTMVNEELTATGAGTFTWDGHHTHNGINSPVIDATSIYAGPSYAGATVVVGATGYLTFVPPTVSDLPAKPTAVKMRLAAAGDDTYSTLSTNILSWSYLTPSRAADVDIIWTPLGGSQGAGEVGVTYRGYISEFEPDETDSPTGGTWSLITNGDIQADNTGADAVISSKDLNDTGELREGYLYRLIIIATKTSGGRQTTSDTCYFKLGIPS